MRNIYKAIYNLNKVNIQEKYEKTLTHKMNKIDKLSNIHEITKNITKEESGRIMKNLETVEKIMRILR